MTTKEDSHPHRQRQQHIILFYKYHPLSNDRDTTAIYRDALENLCRSLSLKGRILVGHSESEGINGTLAGEDEKNVRAFTFALLGERKMKEIIQENSNHNVDTARQSILEQFWNESQRFFDQIGQPNLELNSPDDFKWSRSEGSDPLFPDLNIKLVKELVGTGGVMASIPLEETAKGYLTPQEWHSELSKLSSAGEEEKDAILIDCRNTKECEIGHFEGAIDPKTTTFAQFPQWVREHKHVLADKKVYMYCTGGIRCEKASAYIRREVPNAKSVKHLKGGIHKYLEEVVESGHSLWKGKNFVFDTRGAASALETKTGKDCGDVDKAVVSETTAEINAGDIVGKCIYCQAPWDRFDPHCVCTVCREPTLVCENCQTEKSEYHCKEHFYLRNCYFFDLPSFSRESLSKQLEELETILIEIAVGKRYKQKRKTLHKQCDKIRQYLSEMNGDTAIKRHRCRNCDDEMCNGRCWGFYSLKRKELLEQKKHAKDLALDNIAGSVPVANSVHNRKRSMKECKRDRAIEELNFLKLCSPPSEHRNAETSIRVPPPCTRVLETKMKGKWNGLPVLQVVKDEFMELSKPGVLQAVIDRGLLRVNGKPVAMENAGVALKTGDTISRIVHWHEPPVQLPERIGVRKEPLPEAVLSEYGIPETGNDRYIYVCNKPSSVPVHPAGQYLSNSLTMLVEAQEGLRPQSLFPCHRTDRVTSGLTICCTNTSVARIVQRSMCEHEVQKLYLARVHGRFPSSTSELSSTSAKTAHKEHSKVAFVVQNNCVSVDAPVDTVDPANGIRKVTEKGKPSKSLFRMLSYDPDLNVSLIACRPITGRNHQLRVHLQLLGFPIVNDVLYGGTSFVSESSKDTTNDEAIKALVHSTFNPEDELKGSDISESDARAAREACALCQSLKENTTDACATANAYFTPAQLLRSGHSIDLHNFWYRVTLLPKGKRVHSTDGNAPDHLGVLDLKVEHPCWADPSHLSDVAWLPDGDNED